ncbi:MAG: outer membrane lipoprotein-sorting protein [Candidatus Marinamargulisbacteria bacterium]
MVNHVFAMSGLDVMTLVQKESQKKNTRKAVVHMKIYDDQDRERVRFFNYWTKYKLSREDSLIKFFRPKNVKGTSLLTNSNTDHDSKSQWVYLPAFKSVKRLSSSDKNKSFMGSDFTYSDIAGRKLTQDDHKLIKDTDHYYYVESIPKDIDDSIYSKIRYVISKKYNVINKAIFYDLEGKKLKTLSNSKISIVNDVNVVMYSEMINHQTKGKTELNVSSMDVGLEIKDDLLSIKGLKSQ